MFVLGLRLGNLFNKHPLFQTRRRQETKSGSLARIVSYSANRAAPISGWSLLSRQILRISRLAPPGPNRAEMKMLVSTTTIITAMIAYVLSSAQGVAVYLAIIENIS